jgi:hypothetical protein
MNNPQWYKRFNTKVDGGDAIGVTRQHKSLLEHVAQEQSFGTTVVTFASLTTTQQDAVRIDTEECYLSYVFLRQSGAQHAKLKVDLQNDFTTGDCWTNTISTLLLLGIHSLNILSISYSSKH